MTENRDERLVLMEIINALPVDIQWAIDPPNIDTRYLIAYILETIKVSKRKERERMLNLHVLGEGKLLSRSVQAGINMYRATIRELEADDDKDAPNARLREAYHDHEVRDATDRHTLCGKCRRRRGEGHEAWCLFAPLSNPADEALEE